MHLHEIEFFATRDRERKDSDKNGERIYNKERKRLNMITVLKNEEENGNLKSSYDREEQRTFLVLSYFMHFNNTKLVNPILMVAGVYGNYV